MSGGGLDLLKAEQKNSMSRHLIKILYKVCSILFQIRILLFFLRGALLIKSFELRTRVLIMVFNIKLCLYVRTYLTNFALSNYVVIPKVLKLVSWQNFVVFKFSFFSFSNEDFSLLNKSIDAPEKT